MKLETTIRHQVSTKILVNGTTYDIDGDGVVDVKKEDAEKMLQSPTWLVFDTGKKREAASGPRRAASRMALIGADGAEHQREVPTLEEVKDAGYSDEAAAAIVAEETAKAAGDIPPPPVHDDALPLNATDDTGDGENIADGDGGETKEEANEEDASGDPPIPEGDDGEWADPLPEYSMDWLRACADAYDVKYAKNIGAEKLVEKIKKEMYT